MSMSQHDGFRNLVDLKMARKHGLFLHSANLALTIDLTAATTYACKNQPPRKMFA